LQTAGELMRTIEDYVEIYGEEFRELIETNLDQLRDVPEEFRFNREQRDKFIDKVVQKAKSKQ
jgi:hypothetical protein